MAKVNPIDWFFLISLIIGGINWGLVGLFNYNLIAGFFGTNSGITNLIYIIIGMSALYVLTISLVRYSKEAV